MKQYMLLYVVPGSAEDLMKNTTPEEAGKMKEVWMAWFQKAGSAIVDGGHPLGNAQVVGGNQPDTHVAGYSVAQANSLDKIKDLLVDHPHLLMPGASIEIREMLPM